LNYIQFLAVEQLPEYNVAADSASQDVLLQNALSFDDHTTWDFGVMQSKALWDKTGLWGIDYI
jgi:hypothetical protein